MSKNLWCDKCYNSYTFCEDEKFGFHYCNSCHDWINDRLKNSGLALEYLQSNNHDAYDDFLRWLENKLEISTDENS